MRAFGGVVGQSFSLNAAGLVDFGSLTCSLWDPDRDRDLDKQPYIKTYRSLKDPFAPTTLSNSAGSTLVNSAPGLAPFCPGFGCLLVVL